MEAEDLVVREARDAVPEGLEVVEDSDGHVVAEGGEMLLHTRGLHGGPVLHVGERGAAVDHRARDGEAHGAKLDGRVGGEEGGDDRLERVVLPRAEVLAVEDLARSAGCGRQLRFMPVEYVFYNCGVEEWRSSEKERENIFWQARFFSSAPDGTSSIIGHCPPQLIDIDAPVVPLCPHVWSSGNEARPYF